MAPDRELTIDSDRNRVVEQIDIWRKQLINLARSNRLLYFRHTKTSTLEIRDPNATASQIVARLITGEGLQFRTLEGPKQDIDDATGDLVDEPLQVPNTVDQMRLLTTKGSPIDLDRALRSLDRRATQEFMDKGIWILYLAAGFLGWNDPETGENIQSPLVLIPVRLHRENPREPYELRMMFDEELAVNPALVLKLSEFGIELPVLDGDDFVFDEVLSAVERAVSQQADWTVEPRLVIAPFSFHKEVMYRDLLANEALLADHLLVQALALGAGDRLGLDFEVTSEGRLDDVAPPEKVVTILDADATQMQCITAAIAGRSFVMDGPPGTGKSQTIANIIAALLARQKSVLFVSEKAAALEVVHKRLQVARLSDYCLELHSHKASRKEVAQELGRALRQHPPARRAMSDSDLSTLAERRRELSERALEMNVRRMPLARSLHEVIGRIAQLDNLPQAPPPTQLDDTLSAAQLSQILSVADELSSSWGPVERAEDFLWRELADTVLDAARSQRTHIQIRAALEALNDLRVISAEVAETLLLPMPTDFAGAERLLRVVERLQDRPLETYASWLTVDDLGRTLDVLGERRQAATLHERAVKSLLEHCGKRWREADGFLYPQFHQACQHLSASQPLCSILDRPLSEISMLSDFLASGRALLLDTRKDASLVAEQFGLPNSELSARRILEMAKLAALTSEIAKPERSWLNSSTLAAVEQATKVLEPLCRSFSEQQSRLTASFSERILELDLEGLWQRFQSRKGLAKLGSSYRADKRMLATAVKTGKVNKGVIELLPRALEWKRIADQLHLEEQRNADLLGDYYRSTKTDFEAVTRALTNAHTALSIAGRHLDAERTASQVARDALPNPELLAAADRIRSGLQPWLDRCAILLPELGEAVMEMPIDQFVAWADDVAQNLEILIQAERSLSGVVEPLLSVADVAEILEARATVAAIEEALERAVPDDEVLFGDQYQLFETNWDALESAISWAVQLRDTLGFRISLTSADRLLTTELSVDELERPLYRWTENRNGVLRNFLNQRAQELQADLSFSFEEAERFLHRLDETISDIDEWVQFNAAKEELANQCLDGVTEFCERHRVPADQVTRIIERACLERWADVIIEKNNKRLGHLRYDQLDHVLDQFRRLDREVVTTAASVVISSCNGIRPQTTIGAAGTILREAEKLRRHMPVRRLLEEAGEVAQALKPCFMMSPLTVSQFLPSSLHFDVVIFDEASQVRPSDAINCIYRGAQLIIAGDDQQLPPTSFFESVSVDGDDEWEEEQFEDFESVIKLSKGGGLKEMPLRWHYRSQHEDLIAYSNFAFYEGRLITFPGATAQSEDLGVKLIVVSDGVYRRGTARDNPREAEVVVDRVLYWARMALAESDKALTVGVVALSEAQATAIETALDRRRRELPDLDSFFAEDRLDGFFVKNLESVQGDERDVMIFSVGYGRDERGRLTMNFGPLNHQGGERRLNVAITRARRRVELVSSVTGTEPEFGTNLSNGPRHLQRYLEFAERGPVALAIDLPKGGLDAESPFEEEVIRVVRSWGYRVQPQVGTAGYRVDIGVWHPDQSGRFALGIECDGSMYHSSQTARDRDRLRQEVLENLGWRIHRIWGTSWYRYRADEERRLKDAIESAIRGELLEKPTGVEMSHQTLSKTEEEFEEIVLDAAPTWATVYRVAEPRRPRPTIQMHLPEARADLRRMILEVAEVEGPIEDEVLLRRIREAWGIGRAGERIRYAFMQAIETLVKREQIKRLETTFTYLREDQVGVVRVPDNLNERTQRSVGQISLAEQTAAVLRLVQDAHRVTRDELTFAVCRLFGWNRRGSEIAFALDQAVDALVQDALIEEDGGYVRAIH